jgi:hypothetical protein
MQESIYKVGETVCCLSLELSFELPKKNRTMFDGDDKSGGGGKKGNKNTDNKKKPDGGGG